MAAGVVADVEVEGHFQFDRQKIGTSPAHLRALADWLVEREVTGSIGGSSFSVRFGCSVVLRGARIVALLHPKMMTGTALELPFGTA
jgi:hypothetical protein